MTIVRAALAWLADDLGHPPRASRGEALGALFVLAVLLFLASLEAVRL